MDKRGDILKRLPLLFALALITAFVLECLNGRTLASALSFVAHSPGIFLVNALIVFNIYLLSELFRRRTAAMMLSAFLIVLFGIANAVITYFRVQPFNMRDFLLVKMGIRIFPVYFSWAQIIGMGIGALGVVVCLTYLFLKLKPRPTFSRVPALVCIVVSIAFTFGMCRIAAASLPWDNADLIGMYKEGGFAYSFVRTLTDMGVKKPARYGESAVKPIMDGLPDAMPEPEVKPNIVLLQLESFFDVNELSGASFSENPIPNYTRLSKSFPTGALYVPVVGGGTCNTEFEALTGMNVDLFAAGEFPFNTALDDQATASLCFDLASNGYSSTAIHNYSATYYERDKIYSHLGFNDFVSMEYMCDISYNPLGWAMDRILTREIVSAIERTRQPDLIFAMSVQSHGRYPVEHIAFEHEIEVSSCDHPLSEGQLYNFANELYEVDMFIGELVEALSDINEPTVLVMYGDHLPAIGIYDPSQLNYNDLYRTEYLVWNNYGAELQAPDIEAYRLGAEVLRQLQMSGGVVTRYNQSYPADILYNEYLDGLAILEYDVLYGEKLCLDEPYAPTALRLGGAPITINGASVNADKLVVSGENFTEFSHITLNGERLDTEYVDPRTLTANAAPQAGAKVAVTQVTPNGEELTRTPEYILP